MDSALSGAGAVAVAGVLAGMAVVLVLASVVLHLQARRRHARAVQGLTEAYLVEQRAAALSEQFRRSAYDARLDLIRVAHAVMSEQDVHRKGAL